MGVDQSLRLSQYVLQPSSKQRHVIDRNNTNAHCLYVDQILNRSACLAAAVSLNDSKGLWVVMCVYAGIDSSTKVATCYVRKPEDNSDVKDTTLQFSMRVYTCKGEFKKLAKIFGVHYPTYEFCNNHINPDIWPGTKPSELPPVFCLQGGFNALYNVPGMRAGRFCVMLWSQKSSASQCEVCKFNLTVRIRIYCNLNCRFTPTQLYLDL